MFFLNNQPCMFFYTINLACFLTINLACFYLTKQPCMFFYNQQQPRRFFWASTKAECQRSTLHVFFVTPRTKQPAQDQSITIPISIRPASVPLPFRFRPVSVPLPSASVPLPSGLLRFRSASIPLPDRFPSASLLLPAPACPTFSGLPFTVEYINTCSPEPFSSAQSFSGGNFLSHSTGVFF